MTDTLLNHLLLAPNLKKYKIDFDIKLYIILYKLIIMAKGAKMKRKETKQTMFNRPAFNMEVKRTVLEEKIHIKELERQLELVDNRIMMKKFMEIGANIVITNSYGRTGKTTTNDDLDKLDMDKLKKLKADIENGIERGRNKQKFYTYIYNNNYEKAKRIGDIIQTNNENTLDELMFESEGKEIIVNINQSINGEEDGEFKNEMGIHEIGKQFIDYKKHRETCLEVLKKRLL